MFSRKVSVMVLKPAWGHLADPNGSAFHCRFCALEIDSYVGVLFHELKVHTPRFSCRGCESFLGNFSSHYSREHRETGDGREESPVAVKEENLVDEADPLAECFEDCGEEGPVGSLPEEAACNSFIKREFALPSPVHDVTIFRDRAPFPAEKVDCLFDSTARVPSPTEEVEVLQDLFEQPPWPAAECEIEADNADDLDEEELDRPPPVIIVPKIATHKKGPTISVPRALAIEEILDETMTELEKPMGAFARLGLRHDTDAGLYCDVFEDVVDTESESPADDVPALQAKFVTEVYGCLMCEGFRRERIRGPGGRRDPCLCPFCALPFARETALSMHLYRVHGDDSTKLFKCLRCDKNYANRSFLVRHCAWMRFGKKFKCKMWRCEEHFATTTERSQHVMEVHGGIKCKYCGEKFVNYSSWRLHIDKYHDETEEELTCRICRWSKFTDVAELKFHEAGCRKDVNKISRPQVATDESSEPNVPKKRGRKPGTTLKKVVDPDEKVRKRMTTHEYQKQQWLRFKQARQKCSICSFMCFTPSNRLEHEEQCHFTDEDGAQVHKCAECADTFVHVRDLNRHIKIHPGMGRFQCPHCPRKYMQSSGLSSHVTRVHRKVRYKCEQCGEIFVRKTLYQDHLAKHEGTAKYVCPDCGKKMFHYPTWYDHKKRYCPKLKDRKPRVKRIAT